MKVKDKDITKYDVEFLYYTKNNNTWTNKGSVYLGNSNQDTTIEKIK